MRVYGFDANKNVHAVEMSVDDVVEHGIHPWRVDLFERRPIALELDGQTLSFSPIDNVAFAWVEHHSDEADNAWSWAHIGQILDGQAICIEGCPNSKDVTGGTVKSSARRLREIGTLSQVHLGEFSLRSDGFEELLRQYLQKTSGQYFLPCQVRNSLVLAGGILHFCNQEPLNGPRFGGEMFADVRIRRTLPSAANWVFQEFEDWNATLIGGVLRDTILGEAFNDVDFIVDAQSPEALSARLAELGATEIEDLTERSWYGRVLGRPIFCFTYQGTKYHVISRGTVLGSFFWQSNDFSINQLRAERPDESIASRIALYDLGLRQTRLVSSLRHGDMDECLRTKWQERAAKFAARGFDILANLFASDELDRLNSTL